MTGLGELFQAVAATAAEALERLEQLGNHGTAGPTSVTSVDEPTPAAPRWTDGWWSGARRTPAHAGRVGPQIRPCCTVVHTTDMLPDEWNALLTAWQTRPGDGACAHFIIGRDKDAGVAQCVPITRNGNHAGGPGHGVFKAGSGPAIHPNTIAVGIELHCAGGVQRVDGAWRLVEGGKAHGTQLYDFEVIPDPQRPGRGWHVITDYQREQLRALLADLELVLAPMPAGLVAKSTGEAVPSWGTPTNARIVGHVSLDPAHRSDPWPPMMRVLNAR